MNLGPVMQSEASQKEKNKFVYSYIYMESRKMVLFEYESICGAAIETDIENRIADTAGEGEGQLREQPGNIHITVCKTDSECKSPVVSDSL